VTSVTVKPALYCYSTYSCEHVAKM